MKILKIFILLFSITLLSSCVTYYETSRDVDYVYSGYYQTPNYDYYYYDNYYRSYPYSYYPYSISAGVIGVSSGYSNWNHHRWHHHRWDR